MQWEFAGSLPKVSEACQEFVGSSPKGLEAYRDFAESLPKVSEACWEFARSLLGLRRVFAGRRPRDSSEDRRGLPKSLSGVTVGPLKLAIVPLVPYF
ncbi:hypothetical protein B296_00018120 [Ensete ventricosum]|uniref:Uncharacterized protein n=1 Tax=Ensete ventricosum TaxID=4639 RepID=A0A427AJA2_ENSVE|nr:hypothetical protein B296_00018120 [Ensete ventricosum]